ncbi:unnamed protein product [Euphydryas editha]|uniref:Uncharacterized protein n=1 Tax=Euphydryas editha TaxID=104508 RepID=A0AAU9USP4_EUPED|nr:unnamed protein product [Euphydryas editha]
MMDNYIPRDNSNSVQWMTKRKKKVSKREMIKRRKVSGETRINHVGRYKSGVLTGPDCRCKRLQCFTRLTTEQRKEILEIFYKIFLHHTLKLVMCFTHARYGIMYSESTTCQTMMQQCTVTQKLQEKKHIFPVRGHTYLPNDADFALIGKKKGMCSPEIPVDWDKIIEAARKYPTPFKVVTTTHDFFFNMKDALSPYFLKVPRPALRLRQNKGLIIIITYLSKPESHDYYCQICSDDDNDIVDVDIEVDEDDNSDGCK